MIYYYDDVATYPTKFEALHKCPSPEKLKFYYFDHVFDTVDWNKEPTESLPTLYKRRAEFLRNTYDYLVLCYSGGIDSTTMLETFYYNNIHIDEIILVGAFSQDDSTESDENHNLEIYKNCFPLLNKLVLKNTTVNILDYTKYFDTEENFTISQYGNMWPIATGAYFSAHNFFWQDIHKYINNKNLNNAGIIFGVGKPSINFNPFSIQFSDKELLGYGVLNIIQGLTKINFYTDPTTIDLQVKQFNVVRNKFYSNPNIKNSVQLIQDCIYNLKNPLIYTSPKSQDSFLSLRDTYLIKHRNSRIFEFFKSGYLQTCRRGRKSFFSTVIQSKSYGHAK